MKNKSAKKIMDENPTKVKNIKTKISEIQVMPQSDNEGEMLSFIAKNVFSEFGNEKSDPNTLKEVVRIMFFEWRGERDVGITLYHDFKTSRTTSSRSSTSITLASAQVKYGFGAKNYSEYKKKLAHAKQSAMSA